MAEEKKRKLREVQPTALEWSRYLELDRCLRDRWRAYHMADLTASVNRMLQENGFTPVSERTIAGDLKFMQSKAGFNVKLAKRMDGHTKIYSYAKDGFSIMKMRMTDRESDLLKATIAMLSRFRLLPNYGWLEDTLRTLRTKFKVGDKSASVSLNQNKKLKGMDDWFEPLFDACRKRLIVTMAYKRFDRQGKPAVERVIEPYQMRQWNQRWYLVGREDTKDKDKNNRIPIVVVPIDRIQELNVESIEERDFRELREGGKYKKPKDEELDNYFEAVVGLSRKPDGVPQTVKIKAWGLTAHFIETKPIHHTQKQEEEGEMEVEGPWYKKNPLKVGYKVFEMTVIPNEPLIQALLVYANECEVLEPKELREALCQRARAILAYNDKV